MENSAWYDDFIEILHKKYPKKTQLAQALMELLCIEQEAAYRRLRKDVLFPAHELIKIASAWNISIDEIAHIHSDQISFLMQPRNYLYPSDKKLNQLQKIVRFLDQLSDFPDSEYMAICNILPRSLITGFINLNQFYLFKWMYQYGDESTNVLYSKAAISPKIKQVMSDYYLAIKNVATMNYVWDYMIFDYLVHDIHYYHSIRLITDKEKELIKADIYALLDYVEDVARKGFFPETNNKVNIYISQTNIDTNYSHLYTKSFKIFRIHVFNKYEIYTYNEKIVTKFRTWMQLKKRSSIQISEVDEKNRLEFFTKQRQLIATL